MTFTYRIAAVEDVQVLKQLALKAWSIFEQQLSSENWNKLFLILSLENTYEKLILETVGFLCLNEQNEIVGMAFLVPNGNPTEIYPSDWSYIRYVSVDPKFQGFGIGKKLTQLCIDKARENGEHIIALHTSEMMGNAMHIYEKLGFKRVRELEERLGKRYWLYTLNLT